MPPTQRAMRRSCQFCRSRKIRCSGQDKCDACRERNIDCIYGREASKGRPRRAKSKPGDSPGGTPTSYPNPTKSLPPPHAEVDIPDLTTTLFPPADPPPGSLSLVDDITASDAQSTSEMLMEVGTGRPVVSSSSEGGTPAPGGSESGTLAAELETMFRQNFSPIPQNKAHMNIYQEAISSFTSKARLHSMSNSGGPDFDSSATNSLISATSSEFKCVVMSYDAILSLLTQELVEMLSVKYGSLGCHYLGDTGATFYIKSLATDTTPSIFAETPAPLRNPIQDFDLHRTLQMIEIWFAMHPLSTIVSKTLLLRQYRSNTHDEMLLSLIIADALFIGEGKISNSQGEAFFNYAISLLHTLPLRKCSLSTAQALTLLGWHELCLAKARRATCFLGYACRIVNKLMTRAAQVPTTGLSRINGIDAGEVEVELMTNIFWIILSITLWGFMQFDQPFTDLLPSPLSMGFPPVEQNNSIVYKLDLVSGNISTFQRQTRVIRELWALSHITSTVGHIYSLFPRNVRSGVGIPSSLSWQARTLQQLRLLSNPRQDMNILCSRIREILAEATKQVTVERVNSLSSRTTVLSAYHTLIIQLLFPRLEIDAAGPQYTGEPPLTSEVLDVYHNSAKALIELSKSFRYDESVVGSDKVRYSTGTATDPGLSLTTNLFVLGLDTCARALEIFSGRLRSTNSASERMMLTSRKAEFAALGRELHALTKMDRLNIARRVRLVKKHFKTVHTQLDQSPDVNKNEGHTSPTVRTGNASSGSDASSPNNTSLLSNMIAQRSFEMLPTNVHSPTHAHSSTPHPQGYTTHYNHHQQHIHPYGTPQTFRSSTANSTTASSPDTRQHHHYHPYHHNPHNPYHHHHQLFDQFMASDTPTPSSSAPSCSSGASNTPCSNPDTPASSVISNLDGGLTSIGIRTPQSSTSVPGMHRGMQYFPGTPGSNGSSTPADAMDYPSRLSGLTAFHGIPGMENDINTDDGGVGGRSGGGPGVGAGTATEQAIVDPVMGMDMGMDFWAMDEFELVGL